MQLLLLFLLLLLLVCCFATARRDNGYFYLTIDNNRISSKKNKKYLSRVASFGEPLPNTILESNMIYLPSYYQDLCEFPPLSFINTTTTTTNNNTKEAAGNNRNDTTNNNIALFVSRGNCSILTKARVAVRIHQRVTNNALKYIIFDYKDDIVIPLNEEFKFGEIYDDERLEFYRDFGEESSSLIFFFLYYTENNIPSQILLRNDDDDDNEQQEASNSFSYPIKLERFYYYCTLRKLVAILPKFVALLSILGSSYLVYSINNKSHCGRRRRNSNTTNNSSSISHNPKGSAQTFRNLLTALSCSDIISSSAFFLTHWAFPEEYRSEYLPFAYGNGVTCSIQGSIYFFGAGSSIFLTGCISLQYILTVRFRWREAQMKIAERAFFILSYLFPLIVICNWISSSIFRPSRIGIW